MPGERKHTEVFVGLFLLIGLVVIGAMVVMFGRVGQTWTKYYEITVEFQNASGLIQDSDVLLSGARIGYVADPPKLVGRSLVVAVKLQIREDIRIPVKSEFFVGSSGLLGDRYVDVVPKADFDPNEVIPPGALIEGKRMEGLDDLTKKGGEVMEQLKSELEEIQKVTLQLHEGLLSDRNLKNLSATFENLKATSVNFSESSKKLDPIFTKADAAVDSAKSTMKTVDGAAEDLGKAVADLRKVADSADAAIGSAKALFDKANRGQGALGLLLSDKETADNLRAIIANMRRSGPVFYKDREPKPATPAPRSRSR
ncbi:MAG: MlaD family protein [Verrucomicrobiota bacterium]|nr:MlaD family protein [Verrucomicrobiota bacterium]